MSLKLNRLLPLAVVLAVSASAAMAQGPAASVPSAAAKPAMDCSKAANQRHDHAAEGGRGTPHMQYHPCPADNSASAASAAAAKRKARHDHQATK